MTRSQCIESKSPAEELFDRCRYPGAPFFYELTEDQQRSWRFAAEEIKALREGMASEARIIQAQTLDLKSLAKCRREIIEAQVRRMANVALGKERPRTCVRYGRSLEDYVASITAELPATSQQLEP